MSPYIEDYYNEQPKDYPVDETRLALKKSIMAEAKKLADSYRTKTVVNFAKDVHAYLESEKQWMI